MRQTLLPGAPVGTVSPPPEVRIGLLTWASAGTRDGSVHAQVPVQLRSKCPDWGPLGLAGLFLTDGRSAPPGPAVGLRGDAACSPWGARPLWKHGAKESEAIAVC